MREVLLERTSEEILLGEPKRIRVIFKPYFGTTPSDLAKRVVEKRLGEFIKNTLKALLMGEKWDGSIYVPIARDREVEIAIALEESYWEDEEELVLVYRVSEYEYRYDIPIFQF